MPRSSKSDLASLVSRHLRALASGKKSYKRSDLLLDEIERQMEPGQVVKLSDGKTFKFVDKFATKTRINVGFNARRYEFEEIISTS